jgi:hypothetical protein
MDDLLEMMQDDLEMLEYDLEIMEDDLEIMEITRNAKIHPHWNSLEKSSKGSKSWRMTWND